VGNEESRNKKLERKWEMKNEKGTRIIPHLISHFLTHVPFLITSHQEEAKPDTREV